MKVWWFFFVIFFVFVLVSVVVIFLGFVFFVISGVLILCLLICVGLVVNERLVVFINCLWNGELEVRMSFI